VRIAVIDSGVHAGHPHVGGVAGGVAVGEDGTILDEFVDRLGHGTAVTAAIREKAPEAEIIIVKVFWERLATTPATLVRAINEAVARGAGLVNLSLGTTDARCRDALAAAIAHAHECGAFLVAAAEDNGVRWLPGILDGVVPVTLDWSCPREAYRLIEQRERTVVATSGYPRDIPGVLRERNIKGISFAVANATGFVARAMEARPDATLAELIDVLRASSGD
jgi:subtilisin family serine protease